MTNFFNTFITYFILMIIFFIIIIAAIVIGKKLRDVKDAKAALKASDDGDIKEEVKSE